MKKEITLGQLLAVAIAILAPLITGWVTIQKKLTETETRFNIQIEQIKDEQKAIQTRFDRFTERIELKLDKVNENVNSVLVKIETKVDR